MRVAVFGASGRMGQEVCRAVWDDPDLDLVAAIDPHGAGVDLQQVAGIGGALQIAGDAAAIIRDRAEVAIDFTVADAALDNARFCAANGVHSVIGTSGFSPDDIDDLRRRFTDSNCLVAPNFAIGAVLLMRFAEMAAPFFDSCEIIELHHEHKVDAPSGTAMATARRMAAASGDWIADPTTEEVVGGARGGAGPSGIRVHSVRMRGLVAHQEVLLGTTGQTLSIRHDSLDRSSFMPGVLLAAKQIAKHPGLTVGLDALLDV